MEDINDFFTTLEESGFPSDWYIRSISFMLESLSLIRHRLHPIAANAFEAAEQYWKGDSRLVNLEVIQVSCWNYLDTNIATAHTSEFESASIRAVTCVIYATPPDQDVFEFLSVFSQLTNKIEPHEVEQLQLLKKHFG